MQIQEMEKLIAAPETPQPQKRLLNEVLLLMKLYNKKDSADVMVHITAIRLEESSRD